MVTSASGTDLNIIGRTEMGDFRNRRSRSIICIAKFDHFFFRKFTIVGVNFYYTLFALHCFDFRTCLQVHTAVLCARAVIPRKNP